MPRVIEAFKQYLDNAGDPLVSGWLRFTVSGTNNTDKDTFADSNEAILNANPIQLSASGHCPNIFGTGSYRVTSFFNDELASAPGQQLQQFDPVGGTSGVGEFDDWNNETIYGLGDLVTGPDGNYYRSLVTPNQSENPTTATDKWEQIQFVRLYNTNITYANKVMVQDSNGVLWVSLQDGNIAKVPAAEPTWWSQLTVPDQSAFTGQFLQTVDGTLGWTVAATLSGDQTFTGHITFVEISDTVYALAALDIDPANGVVQTKTITGNVTFTESLTSGQLVELRLFDADGFIITWPTITWTSPTGNVAPVLTANDSIILEKIGAVLYGKYSGSSA